MTDTKNTDTTADTLATPTPIAEDMRHELCWLAKNLEEHAEGDVSDYTLNSSRSSLLKLFGMTTDVQTLESLDAWRREKDRERGDVRAERACRLARQIGHLQEEAKDARDLERYGLCALALEGDREALAKCERILIDTQGMEPADAVVSQ